jgi:hypothetical protein
MFAAMLGGWEIILILGMLIGIPLGAALFAFWIWMLVHAAQNKGLAEGEKVAWVLIIALLHFLGALIYFFVGKPKAILPPVRGT